MDTVIVTGAGGFLGSAVVRKLVYSGKQTIGVVRSRQKNVHLPNVDYAEGDLTKSSFWQDLSFYECCAVLHLAAAVPPSFTGAAAQSAAELNRALDDHAINFCEQKGVRLIFASSTSVYGLSHSAIYRETDQCNSVGPYAVQKHDTEKKMMRSSRLRNSCALRISAPYGPAQRARTVIRIFLESALRNEPLFFYGSGSRTQDFAYIDDVANAFLMALTSDAEGIFNIACGEPIAMKDLAFLITRLIPNCTSEVKASSQEDPQEYFRANYDISLAKAQFGWSPQIGLKEGLSKYILFLKEKLCL